MPVLRTRIHSRIGWIHTDPLSKVPRLWLALYSKIQEDNLNHRLIP